MFGGITNVMFGCQIIPLLLFEFKFDYTKNRLGGGNAAVIVIIYSSVA